MKTKHLHSYHSTGLRAAPLPAVLLLATLSHPCSPASAQSSWNLNGNLVAPGQFLGSTNRQAIELWAAGYRVLRLEPDPSTASAGNLIGGYTNNVIEQPGSGGNVIAGGGFSGGPDVIRPQSRGNFIGAGSGNQIGPAINDAAIAGGFANRIEGFNSFIGSGYGNTVQGYYSAVGGGDNNLIRLAADHSNILGGSFNDIVGSETLAVYGSIGGGYDNQIQTNASFATVAGGMGNRIYAGASNATVGGGDSNISGGQSATVPGGSSNAAYGDYSLAAGRLAAAVHDGTFVWAAGAKIPYRSIRPYTFNAYTPYGASFDYGGQDANGRGERWFYVGNLSAGNTVAAWNGACLTDGGVWANASDKHRKTAFEEVNPRDILNRLSALPVRAWRYTNETVGIKHLGPTAQDFQAAFGYGPDDKSIGTVDADGVALTAIQGLHELVKDESTRRDAEESDLRRQLGELRQLVNSLKQQMAKGAR